jgi:hypothetical protein
MKSEQINLIFHSSEGVELSSNVSFTYSIVTYESGKLHRNDKTDSPVAWTNKHVPPTLEETTSVENEHLHFENEILDSLQVKVLTEVMLDYCTICCQDDKVGGVIAWGSNLPCHNMFHQLCILWWLMMNECHHIPLLN